MLLRVVSTVYPILVEDMGRFMMSIYGVGVCGAVDLGAFFQAQRLLGNPDDFPVLEITLGQVEFFVTEDIFFTVTGAALVVKIDGKKYFSHQRLFAPAYSRIVLEVPRYGVKSYLAIRGKFVLQQVLGSYSTDTLNKIGPAPLISGDSIEIALDIHDFPPVSDICSQAHSQISSLSLCTQLELCFYSEGDSYRYLLDKKWQVHPLSNRTALRLVTTSLPEIPGAVEVSNPVFRGAMQITPHGELVIFLSDHPTTGGYTSIGAVDSAYCDYAAQLRPGAHVKLVSTNAEEIVKKVAEKFQS